MELNIKQSETADKLLRELIKNHRLDKEPVISYFENKDEARFVCDFLSKERLINLMGPTEGAPFMFITPNEDIGIATFLDCGGLSKIARDRENERVKQSNRESKQDEVLDLDLKLKKFETKIGRKIFIAGIIITAFNLLVSLFFK